ncbi:MAG: hypothetical protein V3T31_10655, partial [candidate division Zixibacteria bacterium]
AAQRRFSAFVILGATFVSFTLLLGLSFWQGSRLHYPAEMAWAVLLPYLGVWLFAYGCGLTGRILRADRLSETAVLAKRYLEETDSGRL